MKNGELERITVTMQSGRDLMPIFMKVKVRVPQIARVNIRHRYSRGKSAIGPLEFIFIKIMATTKMVRNLRKAESIIEHYRLTIRSLPSNELTAYKLSSRFTSKAII